MMKKLVESEAINLEGFAGKLKIKLIWKIKHQIVIMNNLQLYSR